MIESVQSKLKTRVLVFPCGSENAAEIHQALRYSLHVELIGASSVEDHGRFRFENYIGGLPNINSDDFNQVFQRLIADNGINVVFATHDTVAEYLSPHADAMGFHLVNGDIQATAVARRKSSTYELFAGSDWTPRVYPNVESVTDWPVVIKPDLGQGGQGVTKAATAAEAALAVENVAQPVITEYLPGQELTVDCFTDRHRNVIFVGPRTRERVKAGITMRSQLLEVDPAIEEIAKEINRRLVLRGPWFFQLKKDRQGQWKLLEISCRVAGAMVSQRARGVNLPLMTIQDYLGRDIKALVNPSVRLIERNISTKAEIDFEFDNVFVDLDDTLIIDGFATPQVLGFIYQMHRLKRRIVLITRHAYDIGETLARARISSLLFDEVIHITDGSAKSKFVKENSIFVDNHFPERLDVALNCGVPVFDVDALEFFIR
ncbi:ATP-grasp domain-containing protein [Paraburkholderia silvatlantica]|uniref:ATP-grasp domain-containing protein n=1 Tax=Paraburkholderia silvatlantica TaxID=321895 RepID=UPI0037522CB6